MTWSCSVCTLKNVNDTFLACEACGSERKTAIGEYDTFSDGRSESPEPQQQKAAAPAPRRPTRAAPKLAPPPSPIAESAVSKKDKNNVDQLKPIYQELVETERIYVQELQAVVNVYLMPLMSRAQASDTTYLNLTEVNAIFGNIGGIANLNQELLNEFNKALQAIPEKNPEGRVEGICRSFLMYASHLKMYAVYAIQFDEAQSRLKRLETERFRFVEFINLAGGMNDITANQPLSSFLIKPIQRICKYPLFFHQMIKLVSEGSPAHAILKRALDAASDVASKINADKLRAEQNLRGFEVAKRLEHLADVVLEPGRRYVGEWKCFLSEGNNSLSMKRRSLTNKMITTEKKARTCFLFNDVLVVTKEVGTGPKLRYELRLWMSMDQLQFAGTANIPRSRDETSSAATQPPETPGNNGDDKQDRSFKSKLFQLPLELIHVASTDRERCQQYRERQHQAQTSQIGQIAARRPSFLKKKDKNHQHSGSNSHHNSGNNHHPTDTIITAYTMWFRSGAERARVGNLIENTLRDFEDKTNSRVASKNRPTLDALPPASPTRRGEDSTRSLTSLNGGSGRAHFASSEDSGADESDYPIRRVQSMDSGMDQNGVAADMVSPFSAAKKSGVFSSDPLNVSAHSFDPSILSKGDESRSNGHSSKISTTTTNGGSGGGGQLTQSEGDLQKPQLSRRRSSNRPRPPPPPPPSVILAVPPAGSQQRQQRPQQQQQVMAKSISLNNNKSVTINSVVSMRESDLDLLQSITLNTSNTKSIPITEKSVAPVSMIVNDNNHVKNAPQPEDLLISKWFGE